MLYKNATLVSLILLLIPLTVVSAEEFRGNPKALVRVGPEHKEGIATPLELGDVLFISRIDPYDFLEGVELEIRPPAAAVREPFSVAVTIHHADARFPGEGATLISGELLLEEELQGANRFYYRVPLRNGVAFHRQADTRVLDSAVSLADERPLTIGFWPRMKGLPSGIERGEFLVTVRPVLADRGGARVQLLKERTGTPVSLDEGETELLIDGEAVSGAEVIHFLSVGLHRIRVESDRYLPAEATFAVEPGEISTVRLELRERTTEVRISLPSEVELYVNGNPLDHADGSAELPVGEHLILLQLGGYTAQRTITLRAGRTYELSLDLDVFLQEN
ncbi:MAG: PEGA domain-containing protein [Spirochaetaceae bacterium]